MKIIQNLLFFFQGLYYYYFPPSDFAPTVITQPLRFFQTKFDKNNIVHDFLFEYKPLDIQLFLNNGYLSDYEYMNKTATEIINNSAKKHGINPKLILVNLEKENHLITRKDIPEPTIMEQALSFGLSDVGMISLYSGFDKQIYFCAKTYRRWFDYAKQHKKMNKQFDCSDDDGIYPINAATYSMYKYCPYVGSSHVYFKRPEDIIPGVPSKIITSLKYKAPFGNYLLFKLWTKWWPKDFK